MKETRRSTHRWSYIGIAVLGLAVAIPGCDSNENGSMSMQNTGNGVGIPAAAYVGTLTGSGGTSGMISVTVMNAAPATSGMRLSETSGSVAGKLWLAGGTVIDLTGTSVPSGPLSVAGGGYSFTGISGSGMVSGTWTGPGTSGAFAALTSGGPLAAYCGTFTGDDGGVWNITRFGTSVAGSFTGANGSSVLTGSMENNEFSLTFPGGTAIGTLGANDSSAGTWTAGTGSGTWQGDLSSCPATPGMWDY